MKIRFCTFYFSGTGNTWWVVKEFTRLLKANGHDAEMLSIEKDKALDIDFLKQKLQESTGIGIAYPIHSSDAPNIVWDFLDIMIEARQANDLDQNPHQFGYVLTSMTHFSGDGALVLSEKMKKAGLKLKYATNIRMTSNLSVPVLHWDPLPETEYEIRKSQAIQKIKQFVEDIREGKHSMEGRNNPIGKIGGWCQRVLQNFTPLMDRLLKFTVDHEKCNQCLTCMKYCPTENIALEKGKIKFGNKCTHCMRCYNYCPTSAIHTKVGNCDPQKYKRFKGPSKDFQLDLIADPKKPDNSSQ